MANDPSTAEDKEVATVDMLIHAAREAVGEATILCRDIERERTEAITGGDEDRERRADALLARARLQLDASRVTYDSMVKEREHLIAVRLRKDALQMHQDNQRNADAVQRLTAESVRVAASTRNAAWVTAIVAAVAIVTSLVVAFAPDRDAPPADPPAATSKP